MTIPLICCLRHFFHWANVPLKGFFLIVPEIQCECSEQYTIAQVRWSVALSTIIPSGEHFVHQEWTVQSWSHSFPTCEKSRTIALVLLKFSWTPAALKAYSSSRRFWLNERYWGWKTCIHIYCHPHKLLYTSHNWNRIKSSASIILSYLYVIFLVLPLSTSILI